VTGKIDAVWTDHVFELEGTRWAFDDNIMVITSPGLPLSLRTFGRDDELIVTGTVRRFVDTAEEIERALRISFPPEVEVRLKGRLLLIADSIRVVGDVTPRVDGDQTSAIERTPKVHEIKAAPVSYDDRRVRLAGTVDEIVSDRAFELDGTAWAFGDDIMVLTRTPIRIAGEPLARGSELVVSGVVRRRGEDAAEAVGWSPTPALVTRIKDQPVLIADAIRVIDDDGPDGRWSAAPGR